MYIPFGKLNDIIDIDGIKYIIKEGHCKECDLKNNICGKCTLKELKCSLINRKNGIVYKKV
jgi:hypothetical protein